MYFSNYYDNNDEMMMMMTYDDDGDITTTRCPNQLDGWPQIWSIWIQIPARLGYIFYFGSLILEVARSTKQGGGTSNINNINYYNYHFYYSYFYYYYYYY